MLVIFIYDPIEAELPDAGRLILGQGSRQLEVDTTSARLRRAYAAEFDQRQAAIETLCRQRQTPRLSISTERDVAEQVRERLGHTLQSGRRV